MDRTAIESLVEFLHANPRLAVISGAGISEAAGIPTYRDSEGTWLYSKPIQHQEFLADPRERARYWARSMRGWPTIRDARPTHAHDVLASLEQQARIVTVITQNVDRLHQKAGSERVIDLHGRLDKVYCLGCGNRYCRNVIQGELTQDNPASDEGATPGPDGDVDFEPSPNDRFKVPKCMSCGGTLMPAVVFYGGTVPRERVQACEDAIEEADALLAIGSSLQVFSAFRFCRLANKLGKPIALINPGKSRADAMAQLKINADCQSLLPSLTLGNC